LTFEVKVRNTADGYISSLPEKSRRIIRNTLKGLEENPFPGSGGDREKPVLSGGSGIYRLHIACTFTAFYRVDKGSRVIKIHEILTTGQAHKKYGRLSS
jgi:mRNA interferase RelE/StbE